MRMTSDGKTHAPSGPAAQAAFAKKAAHVAATKATPSTPLELIEANHEFVARSLARGEHDDRSVRAPGAPPGWLGAYLLGKRQVLAITNVTFPTIWAWMRAGKFPRARVVGGHSMWLSTEIEAWLASASRSQT